MNPQEEELSALNQRAAAGDRAAVDELLRRLLPDLRAFVRLKAGRLVRLREAESDVVQSVCREVLTHSNRFAHPTEGAFRRWLFTTALRKLSQRRDHHTAEKRDALRTQGGDAQLLSLYARIATPSQHASAREELVRVEEAITSLCEEDRAVIVLSRIVGLPNRELAEELGVSPGAVRMRLHRALARLSVLLDSEAPTD